MFSLIMFGITVGALCLLARTPRSERRRKVTFRRA